MKIFILGNGPIDNSDLIAPERGDLIVRFNMPSKSSMTIAQGKTDYLFAANSKAVFLENIEKGLLTSQAVLSKPTVVMPYHPTVIRAHLPKRRHKFLKIFRRRGIDDGTMECIEAFGKPRLPLLLLSSEHYYQCCASLNIDSNLPSPKVPSTGFIAISYFLKSPLFRDYQIFLAGFSWQGWHGHAWDAERRQIEHYVQQGRVVIGDVSNPTIKASEI